MKKPTDFWKPVKPPRIAIGYTHIFNKISHSWNYKGLIRYVCVTIRYHARVSEGTQYWGAEGILCRIMKLKNPIITVGRASGNMLSQENFEF